VIEATPCLPARIIQVVPRFRPDADGIGETALNLADALLRDHGVHSDIAVYHPPQPAPALTIPDGFTHRVERVAGAGEAAFNAALNRLGAGFGAPSIMLLHYVPYGFSANGTPTWLPAALEHFVDGGGRVLTLFHELFAAPRLGTRTMLTSWLQRRIFRRVLAFSEFAFSTSEDFLEVIARNNEGRRPARLIGMCSTVGEPENPKPLSRRARRIAVFGRFASRKILYSSHLAMLNQLARHLGVEEIADIGPVEDPAWLEKEVMPTLGSPLRTYGTLDAADVSRLLGDSVAGALAYPNFLIGKSGICAAYQAHATAIVLFPVAGVQETCKHPNWPLRAGDLLSLPAETPALLERMQETATGGHRDYVRHRSVRAMCGVLFPALREAATADRTVR
jgi:hypothetical protein